MIECSHKPRKNYSETIDSEVIPMDARARIMVIRLMDTIRKDPAYARSLGIEVGMKKQPACLMGSCPHAEGFTE